jgi:thiamine pyrophosphokinase
MSSGVLVRSEFPVTLVGGGPLEAGDLDAALALAPLIVAADGGLDHLARFGRAPAAVIGDMDSASPGLVGAACATIHAIAEQDSTDFEKCLRSIAAPLVIGVGFLGGRTDHSLAAMNALVTSSGPPVLLLGGPDLCFACPPDLRLDLAAGSRVSVFPMAPVVGRVSEGLRWSVEGLAMAPDGRIGTSNEALGGAVRLGFDRPGAILILPRRVLGQVARIMLSRQAG